MPTPETPTTRRSSGTRGWLLSLAVLATLGFGARSLLLRERDREPDAGARAGEHQRATLHVRVIESSRPVPNARVRVSAQRGLDCAGQTDARGEAELSACPVGATGVRIEAAGFARVTRAIVLDRGDNELEQALVPGARLSGRVIDDQGAALAGAQIQLQRTAPEAGDDELAPDAESELEGADVWQVTTAADGGFTLDTLPAASFAVQVMLAPYESVTLPAVAVPAPQPLLVALQRMAAVAGRVLGPEQQPLAAVMVRLAGSGVWPPRSAESDSRGEFRFGSVPPGVYEVRAERAELVSAPLEGVSVDPGQEVRIDLSLGAGRTLRGSVREASSGRLLSGAHISVSEDALSGAQKRVQSAADGSFELRGLRWLAHLVRVELPGYVAIEARWEPANAALRVTLLRAGQIRGRVEDAQGRPVADAELEVVGQTSTGSRLRLQNAAPLMAADGDAARLRVSQAPALGALSLDNLGVTQGSVPPIPTLPGSSAGPALGASPGYRSGLRGEFALEGIPPGEFRVVARKAGFVTSASGAFELGAGATRDEVRLVLGRGGTISGRVLDGEREPVAQVRVSLNAGTEPLRWTLTDADGAFEFAAVQGRGSLVAQPLAGASAQADIEVAPGSTEHVVITLETATGTLAGRVLDPHGDPIAGARVKIEPSSSAAHVSTTALTARDGTFDLQGLPPPPYTLRAEHVDYAPGPPVFVKSADRSVQLQLDPGESLEGIVVDSTSRDPLSGAQITLQRGSRTDRAQTDREGRFEFRNVARGSYVLLAEADSHVPLSRPVDVSGERAARGAEEFRLAAAGSLSGEVVDRLGVPIWNVEVAAGDPPDWQRSARTDHAGHFELSGLPPGEARLNARKPGVSSVSAHARVHEGVDSPGNILRFDEVVHEPEDEAAEPTTKRPSQSEGRSEAEPNGTAPPRDSKPSAAPLTLVRDGDRVLVERVAQGSPAERLGLRSGDVVTTINGETVRSPAQARGMLTLPPGPGGWLIEVRRNGTTMRLRYYPSR